jgi:hypothetical protein
LVRGRGEFLIKKNINNFLLLLLEFIYFYILEKINLNPPSFIHSSTIIIIIIIETKTIYKN